MRAPAAHKKARKAPLAHESDTTVLSVRLPKRLSTLMTQMTEGGRSTSEVIREMIEQRLSLTYSEPTLEEETAFLWGDERSTLMALVEKAENHQDYSHAEWLYVAEKVQRAASQYRRWYSHVRKSTVETNLRAFAAFMVLCDQVVCLTHPEGMPPSFYYRNMGLPGSTDSAASWVDHVDTALQKIPGDHISVEQAEPALRNLAVALRCEPTLNVDCINKALAPYKIALVQSALRAQYLHAGHPPMRNVDPHDDKKYWPALMNGAVYVGLFMTHGEIRATIQISSHALNLLCLNMAEIDDLILSLDMICAESGQGFFYAGKWQAAALGDITHARHLEVSNCCIRLKEEEANALRETLHAALDRPEVVAVMKAQAWRYGAV